MFKYLNDSIDKIYTSAIIGILKNGCNIPKKIGIIMDGNRRYAKSHNLKQIQGHMDGAETLYKLLEWSIALGIKELTVFAFSIDNFKRTEEEINALFKLFKDNFYKFCSNEKALNSGVRVCIYGNKSLFDKEMNNIFNEIENKSKNNNKIKLNVCIGYNSNEEIYKASVISNKNCQNYRQEFESHLYGGYNCCPDLLIRTSGETRMSNFLTYQCKFSLVLFVDKKWPELTLFDYFKIILRYNYNYNDNQSKIKLLEKENDYNINNE